jgi:hypothetical protein
MCELLFKHIGEFREHATMHVMRFVDNLHDPNSQDKTLVPIKEEKLLSAGGEEYQVFMDEIDDSLYFSKASISQESMMSRISKQNPRSNEHMVFVHDNILFKLTHPSEFVYTKANGDGNFQAKFDQVQAEDGNHSNLKQNLKSMPKGKLFGR